MDIATMESSNMKLGGSTSSTETREIVALLKACAKKKDSYGGTRVHAHIAQRGFSLEKSPYLVTALISMYAKCGMLSKAHQVVDELLFRSVVSWNALISGYAQQGPYDVILNCFARMRNEGLFPDAITLTCILNACAKLRTVKKAERIHAEILSGFLLENDILLNNALIDMYAKCGVLERAQQVLKGIPYRDVVSWSALISGYAQSGKGYEALACFEQMKNEGIHSNVVTFIAVLKACGNIRNVGKGRQIHDEILRCDDLLEREIVLGNALVDMYVKCGDLTRAREMLEELPVRDLVSWSTLLEGYAQNGHIHEALMCFESIQSEGLSLDSIALASLLKACKSKDKAAQIHDKSVTRSCPEKKVEPGSAAVYSYAKCDILEKLQQGQHAEVRNCGKWMDGYQRNFPGIHHCDLQKHRGVVSRESQKNEKRAENNENFLLVSLLRACAKEKDLHKGLIIHADILNRGLLQKNPYLATSLITMYSKCGMLTKAHRVLKELPTQNIAAWNALISGYAQEGLGNEAIDCFEQMAKEGLSPDPVTFICILKACARMGAVGKGEELHDKILARGLLEKDPVLGNALMDMYVKCGALEKAKQVLSEISEQDVVSWSTLIGGYAQQGQGHEALDCYMQMQSRNIFPNAIAFISVLMACGSTGRVEEGRKLHGEIVSRGLLEENVALGAALMDMYAKCGAVAEARRVHEALPVRNEVMWSVLISAYAHEGEGDEALKCFELMTSEGLSPDTATFVSLFNACSSIRAVEKGEQIHGEIVSRGLLGKDIMLGNAFVDMYVKCGMLVKARDVVECLPFRDTVSWNTLMAGYAEQSRGEAAWNCFMQLQREGLSPDSITFMCLLKACGKASAIEQGEKVHDEIRSRGLLVENGRLHNALIGMYARCGILAKARQVLEELPHQDIASWNSLLSEGYSQRGGGALHEPPLMCLRRLQSHGLSPNAVTFACLLSACCRAGKSEEARELYMEMTQKHGIAPDVHHLTCMVAALGSGGHLNEAMLAIEVMPQCHHCLQAWIALLGACRRWENVKLGRLAFDRACAAAQPV